MWTTLRVPNIQARQASHNKVFFKCKPIAGRSLKCILVTNYFNQKVSTFFRTSQLLMRSEVFRVFHIQKWNTLTS